VIHIAIRKSMVHDLFPQTSIAVRALVSAGKFGCPANCRSKSRNFESLRPRHSFKKT
jgi:hypothetical protein